MENKNSENIDAAFDEKILVSNLDKDTVIVTSYEDIYKQREKIAMSTYDPTNQKYSAYFSDNQSPSDDITLDDVLEWANSPQTNLNKVLQINAYIRRLVNMNDIVGKVIESINTNINTEYKLTYNHSSTEGRNKKKKFTEAQNFIHEINDSINLKKIIRDCPSSTYMEGNYIMYLRHDNVDNYQIDVYPLGVVEITDYLVNGEPVVQFNIQQLRTRLQKTYRKNKKNKPLFFADINEEVKANFPKEVYDAFVAGESYVNLDPKYTAVVRINNQNRKYGISSLLRAIPDLIMLDGLRDADNITSKARSKKIIHQKLRKELLGDTGSVKYDSFATQSLEHKNIMEAFTYARNLVIVTSGAGVESIEYVEPKTEMVSLDTYNYYRTKVLATLGISFLMDSGSTSVSTASISITQLMRTINSITEQLENILFRFYRQILIDNGYDQSFAPHISIIDSELLAADIKKSLAEFCYNTLGASRETCFSLAGLDLVDEAEKRRNEISEGYDSLFQPYGTAYTKSANSDNPSGRPKSNENEGKQSYDEERGKSLKQE